MTTTNAAAPISKTRAVYLLAMCDDGKWGPTVSAVEEVTALFEYGDKLPHPEHQSVVTILENISGEISKKNRRRAV